MQRWPNAKITLRNGRRNELAVITETFCLAKVALMARKQCRLAEVVPRFVGLPQFLFLSGTRPTKSSLLNHIRGHGRAAVFDMPIRIYLDEERFEPETTRLLGIAFETAI